MDDLRVLSSSEFIAGLTMPDLGFDLCDGWLHIWWGGYSCSVDLDGIRRPEDLLWLLVHLGRKDWDGQTPTAVTHMILAVAKERNWEHHKPVPHENEAPPAFQGKAAERAKMTPKLRYEVIKRDGYRCRACGFSVQHGARLHVDHIVAIANGGETKNANLQTLCSSCNLGKGAS